MPNEKIRYTDTFDDPNLPDEMQVTVTLKPVACGTELSIVQEGIPAEIPVELCTLGWQESLWPSILLRRIVQKCSPLSKRRCFRNITGAKLKEIRRVIEN